jgi:hypothetical protein
MCRQGKSNWSWCCSEASGIGRDMALLFSLGQKSFCVLVLMFVVAKSVLLSLLTARSGSFILEYMSSIKLWSGRPFS